MPTPREQDIARTMNLISSMDESMNEVLLAFIGEANSQGKRFPGGAEGSKPSPHCDPLAAAMSHGSNVRMREFGNAGDDAATQGFHHGRQEGKRKQWSAAKSVPIQEFGCSLARR